MTALGGLAFLGTRALVRARRRFNFEGRTVLITGGSRGLGLVMARQLAYEGARLGILSRDTAELERAASELDGLDAEVITVPADVGDRSEVEDGVREVQAKLGPIDVLINNAGIIQVGPADAMTLADFENAMRTHFWGPLYTMMAVLPGMLRKHRGRIVNISSIGGEISAPHLLPYSASKFALVGLSSGMRSTLANQGIYVTTVSPGLMRTGSPRNAEFKGQREKEYAWFVGADSLPVISESPERAAEKILDACRHGTAHITFPLVTTLSVKFTALFPNLTAELLTLVDRALPAPDGSGTDSAPGWASETRISKMLSGPSDLAAELNNE
jgi:short-subunit dehydrogenase